MSTVEVVTSELSGPALNWAAAKAAQVPMFEMGHEGNWPGNYEVTKATQVEPAVIRDLMGKLSFEASLRSVPWSPSTDGAQGMPLLHKHAVATSPTDVYQEFGGDWKGTCATDLPDAASSICTHFGETPLIAGLRALVGAILGESVNVPSEILELSA